MKKLLLITAASFCTLGAYAQTVTSYNATNELNCTEQVLTLKANIRSGWHLTSPHVGQAGTFKTSPDVVPLNPYGEKWSITDPILPVKLVKAFNMYMPPAESGSLTGKSTYTPYNYSKFFPLSKINVVSAVNM
ncbi:hypothetical protein SNE25_11400 [Mucilaginibacter sabulilitoris]|uniref:Uncharacterized protein n=1 Tax=Mucilaginibacter sabulilitoris TaxID=1173583 RepID=A0ABZ0TXC6_9SPHI|nr:hypothetical protein [Mucilaginibacter sabulilitoris]WPU96125.1 hypothetical protein SNE25_11400 [Mucilaginibacter sabulilitoris]